ncbi:hypothetical protein PPROV_000923800 [Pycnococcus provasolii]|uniref:Uncharacterized protein n=1 Tax=Pycnococcus provasolii TaxID=41880 RepID=A0A830I047_9CHLO|nr:hypothetical protein PPROV_000923800 [Pycnococcus provasolii]
MLVDVTNTKSTKSSARDASEETPLCATRASSKGKGSLYPTPVMMTNTTDSETSNTRLRRSDAQALVSALLASTKHHSEKPGSDSNSNDSDYAALVSEALSEMPDSAIPKVKCVLEKTLKDVNEREEALKAKRLAEQRNGTTLERMIAEARDWTGGRVSDYTLRRLLEHMRLKEMKSVTVGENREGGRREYCTCEDLFLKVELPQRWSFDTPVPLGSVSERFYTISITVKWIDVYNDDAIAGILWASPFLKEDPVFPLKKFDHIPNKAERNKQSKEALDDKMLIKRQKWRTKVTKGDLKDRAGEWMRGVGLRPKDIAWEDAARAVCAGMGMLARDAPDNNGQFVFKRVMTLLERHLKALNNPGAPDPDEPDVIDNLRKYGGLLTSTPVMEYVKRQARWDRVKVGVKRKLDDSHADGGACGASGSGAAGAGAGAA